MVETETMLRYRTRGDKLVVARLPGGRIFVEIGDKRGPLVGTTSDTVTELMEDLSEVMYLIKSRSARRWLKEAIMRI